MWKSNEFSTLKIPNKPNKTKQSKHRTSRTGRKSLYYNLLIYSIVYNRVMKEIKVSVLVPIYNVEPYLKQCLRSLEKQTLREMEFICLNDGSTDGSRAILERVARRDKRFVVIDKPNTGYGDSMNLGLSQVRGEYVGIVEPDDYIETDAFAELYYFAIKHRADVVRSNYYRFSATSEEVFSQVSPAEAAGQVKTAHDDFHCLRQPPAIWSGLYKAAFLKRNDIQFLPTPGASYQDTGFFWKTLAAAKKIVFTAKPYYHYRTDNANSSVKNLAKVDMVREEYRSIAEFLREHQLYDRYGGIMQATKFATYYWNLLRLDAKLVKKFVPEMRQEFLLAWANNELKRRYFPWKHWWALQFLLHARPLFYLQLKLYRRIKNRT